MAEKGGPRFDVALLRWADVDPLTVTEPISGTKDTGFPPVILPDGYVNWRWQKVWRALESLVAAGTREFEFLADIFDTPGADEQGQPVVGEEFSVSGMGSGSTLYRPGDLRWSAASNSLNTISQMAADGERLYYCYSSVDQEVYAVDPRDGSAIWGTTGATVNAFKLICDGIFVYVSRGANVEIINRDTGAIVATIAATGTVLDLAANGVELVILTGTTLEVYDSLGATPNNVATVAISGAVAIAVDKTRTYALLNTPDRIEARTTQTPAVIEYTTYVPQMAVFPTMLDMISDGRRLFVTVSGGDYQLVCFNQHDGRCVWSRFTDIELDHICSDSRFVWGRDSGLSKGRCYDKSTGELVFAQEKPFMAADGWAVYGTDGASNNECRASQVDTEKFLRVKNNDASRRFFKLAIPREDKDIGPAPWIPWFSQVNNTPNSTTAVFPDPTPYLATTFGAPAGLYRISWYYEFNVDSAFLSGQIQVDLNAGTILGFELHEPSDSGDRYSIGGFAEVQLASSGAHTLNIEWGVEGGGDLTIYLGRLEVVRII